LQPAIADIAVNTMADLHGLGPLVGDPILHAAPIQSTLTWLPEPLT
jgi:hypothetical protein